MSLQLLWLLGNTLSVLWINDFAYNKQSCKYDMRGTCTIIVIWL